MMTDACLRRQGSQAPKAAGRQDRLRARWPSFTIRRRLVEDISAMRTAGSRVDVDAHDGVLANKPAGAGSRLVALGTGS